MSTTFTSNTYAYTTITTETTTYKYTTTAVTSTKTTTATTLKPNEKYMSSTKTTTTNYITTTIARFTNNINLSTPISPSFESNFTTESPVAELNSEVSFNGSLVSDQTDKRSEMWIGCLVGALFLAGGAFAAIVFIVYWKKRRARTYNVEKAHAQIFLEV